jgi:hypothetical protein
MRGSERGDAEYLVANKAVDEPLAKDTELLNPASPPNLGTLASPGRYGHKGQQDIRGVERHSHEGGRCPSLEHHHFSLVCRRLVFGSAALALSFPPTLCGWSPWPWRLSAPHLCVVVLALALFQVAALASSFAADAYVHLPLGVLSTSLCVATLGFGGVFNTQMCVVGWGGGWLSPCVRRYSVLPPPRPSVLPRNASHCGPSTTGKASPDEVPSPFSPTWPTSATSGTTLSWKPT